MSAADLLQDLQARGVKLSRDGDILRVRGRKAALTPAIVAELMARKAELLAALGPDALTRQRWGLAPTEPIPLSHAPPRLNPEETRLVVAAIERQPVPVFDWILGQGQQADKYEADRNFSHRDADLAAALDLLCWQRERTLGGATRSERTADLLKQLAFEDAVSHNLTRKGNPT
jgi:hypothetical protein